MRANAPPDSWPLQPTLDQGMMALIARFTAPRRIGFFEAAGRGEFLGKVEIVIPLAWARCPELCWAW
jgi:hypothetical protein